MASLPFLDKILTFPDGTSYQRLEPITDFRQCHGVTPPERRILFRCRRVNSPEEEASSQKDLSKENNSNDTSEEGEEYILKIKVQIPEDDANSNSDTATDDPPSNPSSSAPSSAPSSSQQQPPPPSPPTAHELRALTLFRDSRTPSAPHLIAFSHVPQPNSASSPLPVKGYVSSTVMSKISGKSLFELGYWSLPPSEREEIQRGFLGALGAVRKLGIEPGDKGLRNVMWDQATKTCGLVDFEMWDPLPTKTTGKNQKEASTKPPEDANANAKEEDENSLAELRKWGLAHKPPAKNWWAEFGIVTA